MSDHDTIIPPALPTETDNAKPEPEVMRVGGMMLNVLYWDRERKAVGHLQRIVKMGAVEHVAEIWYHPGLYYFCSLSYGAVVKSVTTMGVGTDPETAFSRARALGNFPAEFFEALGKEIEP